MKTIYTATHKNIRGCELIRIEQQIDTLGYIKYLVILDSPYNEDKDYSHTVLGLYANLSRAIKFADSYKTICV